jgi:hypothetical protein
MMSRIFGSKKDEIMGEWRKLHKEELHNLYSSSSINRMSRSRRMIWTGRAARMGEKRITQDSDGKARRKEYNRKT